MPELPEVETVRRELEPWLTGATILHARLIDAPAGPKYAHLERAEGQRILAVTRRGKFLLLPLTDGDELIIHLGMTGVLTGSRPARHLRVALALDGARPDTLYFQDTRRFGRLLVAPGGDHSTLPTLDRMGPEPLSATFTPEAFERRLRTRTPIKALILSQRPVAGLGNIYVDEALWRARVHPKTRAIHIPWTKVVRLHAAIVELLTAAIAAQGTTLSDYRTVSGEVGGYGQHLDAYGRTGAACRRCGAPLRRQTIAQRTTHSCPRCQRVSYRPRRPRPTESG